MPDPQELLAVIRAVEIHSASAFSVLGQRVLVTQASGPGPHTASRTELLQQQLYAQAYCHRIGHAPPTMPPGADLTGALAAANSTHERWDTGWRLARLLPNGQVLARRGQEERTLWPGSYLSHDGPGVPPRVGTALSVFCPRGSDSAQPGFYFAFSEAALVPGAQGGLTRLYLNVRAEGAASVLQAVTARLNRFALPFQYKVLVHAGQFTRRDAAVLYVDDRHAHLAQELLSELHPRLRPHLDDDVPLFTRPLAPGLSLAEDPGDGDSFGTSRCARLAEGLWNAFEHGRTDDHARLAEIKAVFTAHGLSLDAPERRAVPSPFARPAPLEVAHA